MVAAIAVAAGGVIVYVHNIATERDRADAAALTAKRERERELLS